MPGHLTNYTEQISLRGAGSSFAIREISRTFWKPNILYRFQQSTSLVPILIHVKPVHV